MPHNEAQWLWFAFFGLGGIGGIAFLITLARDLISTIKVTRARGRM
jgi:hypothetical protein